MSKESGRSVLSRIRSPFSNDRTIPNWFDLGDTVILKPINRSNIEATVIKISLTPSNDPDVPANLKNETLPVYLLEYKDDSGELCKFWHQESQIFEKEDQAKLPSSAADNLVHTS